MSQVRVFASTWAFFRSVAGMGVMVAVIGLSVGYMVGVIGQTMTTPAPVTMSGRVLPDPDGAMADDGEGLDSGNHIARVDGRLLFNLDSLSGEPYADCVALLDTRQVRFPDSITFASVDICEIIEVNR